MGYVADSMVENYGLGTIYVRQIISFKTKIYLTGTPPS